jgi:hypothetical protein
MRALNSGRPLHEAKKKGWTVISMKGDWKRSKPLNVRYWSLADIYSLHCTYPLLT